MKSTILSTTLIIILFSACTNNNRNSLPENSITSISDSLQLELEKEAHEDSVEYAIALSLQKKIKNHIPTDIETKAVESLEGEDAADDPAIWINEKEPEKSLVLGTNKKAGLYVYDLEGNEKQYRKIGRINNVDVRNNFYFNGKKVALVAGSNRSINAISLMYIDPETGKLSDTIKNIKSGVDEVYGVCLYHDILSNKFYVFVNGKGGSIEQWHITGNHIIDAELLRNFTVNSQPEGIVADDKNAMVYFGVEDEAIFKMKANLEETSELIKIRESDSNNVNIVYDIEGLAIFNYRNKDYLLASSQGNFSYAIFELGNNERYITSFTLTGGKVDGAEETDGLEISTVPLNPDFPMGILVVQDGFNHDGGKMVNQNFKYVSLEKVLKLLE